MYFHNLHKFPLNSNTSLQEDHEKIAEKVNQYNVPVRCDNNRYYIEKITYFFIGTQTYYEVTFTPINNFYNKTNRIIAFTKLDIMSNYASKFHIINESIEILGVKMPISIIDGWEVSIRDCEFKNFISILTGEETVVPKKEQYVICDFLTKMNYRLSDLMDFPDWVYKEKTTIMKKYCNSSVFIDQLDRCRNVVTSGSKGKNILRYLLYNMNNAIIKSQRDKENQNSLLSNLYLKYGCLPFEEMPYFNFLLQHPPRLNSIYNCIPSLNRRHEILARKVKNNTERERRLFTPISELEEAFDDIPKLVKTFEEQLYYKHCERIKLVIENEHIFINGYKEDTCEIVRKLCELSESGIPNYSDEMDTWLMLSYCEINCNEKEDILRKMFVNSKVAIVYGSAGVGKTTLVNYVAHYFQNESKLFLAQTNPAVDNLRRCITADNSEFSTIANFTKNNSISTECDLLVVDECSTVSNEDMLAVLNKANFKILLLVGDTYQIDSIQFGNWFSAVAHFISPKSVFELTEVHRTNDKHLLDLWKSVREMDDDTQGLINRQSLSLNFSTKLLTTINPNEVILCLNYDGLYGINNMNRFLQQSNPNPPIEWGIQCYKVNDPILFLGSTRFKPLIYNNMKVKIVGIEIVDKDTNNERIVFDVELEKNLGIDEDDALCYGLRILPSSTEQNTVIQFVVNKIKTTDEDDDVNLSRTLVPFQLAYAVSIHKSQGLEYNSVKIVITDEVDELITHSIFYTAITRAKKELHIYWTPKVEAKVIANIKPRDISDDLKILEHYLDDCFKDKEDENLLIEF